MYTNAVCFSTEKWPLPLVCFRLEGLMELYSQGCERSYTVNSSILRTIEPHLKDFQQLLLDPPKVLASVKSASLSVKCDFIESVTLTFFFSFFFFLEFSALLIHLLILSTFFLLFSLMQKSAILTTVGVLEQPLGNTRLHVARLVASLLQTSDNSIWQELCRLNTMDLLLVSSSLHFSST